jgi:hypothetical protein
MDDTTGSNPRGRKPKGADDATGSTPRGRKPKGADDATGSAPRTSKVPRWSDGDGESGALRRPPAEPSDRSARHAPFGRRRLAIRGGAVAVLVVPALVAALFVLPVQAWLGRRVPGQGNSSWTLDREQAARPPLRPAQSAVVEQQSEQFGLASGEARCPAARPRPPRRSPGWPFDQLQAIPRIRAAGGGADSSASVVPP